MKILKYLQDIPNLIQAENKKITKLLMYNSDAVKSTYKPKFLIYEFHLPIKWE